MVEIAAAPQHHEQHLTLTERALNYTAWGTAVALFVTVGWMAMAPDDPFGAVSLMTRGGAGLMVLQIAGLAGVVSAVATLLVGRRLADAGVFAAAVGLAVANLRGETSSYILINLGQADVSKYRSIYATFVVEGFVWFLVILVAMVVGGLVMRWCLPAPARSDDSGATLPLLAISEIPFLARFVGAAPISRAAVLQGLKNTATTSIVALLVLQLISAGDPSRAIRHGQTYFSIALAFYAGALLAHEFAAVPTAWWSLLATPCVCAIGYFWSLFNIGNSQLASIPPTPYARATPIEYVAVGSAAVVAAFWLIRRSAASKAAAAAQQTPARKKS